MKFDKPTARKIRDAMQEALDKADVNGVTIEIGNCSFTEGEATYKVKVLIDGAKSRDEEALEQMATLMGLRHKQDCHTARHEGVTCKLQL